VGFDGETKISTFGALGAGGLELLDARAVAGGLVGHDHNGQPAGQRDGLGVGRPVRGDQQDLVARVEQRGAGVVNGLLAPIGDQT
jgi:hypothetical protein